MQTRQNRENWATRCQIIRCQTDYVCQTVLLGVLFRLTIGVLVASTLSAVVLPQHDEVTMVSLLCKLHELKLNITIYSNCSYTSIYVRFWVNNRVKFSHHLVCVVAFHRSAVSCYFSCAEISLTITFLLSRFNTLPSSPLPNHQLAACEWLWK